MEMTSKVLDMKRENASNLVKEILSQQIKQANQGEIW
jgi:hypothetical protein